jgi:hypothetical protein
MKTIADIQTTNTEGYSFTPSERRRRRGLKTRVISLRLSASAVKMAFFHRFSGVG